MQQLLAFGTYKFDGRTFDPKQDGMRLSSAVSRVFTLLSDGKPHTQKEMAEFAGCSEAGAQARARDLRKDKFGAHEVISERLEGGLWTYRMVR